ncbi:MAG: formate dehydrogenase subunit alpha [Brevefilum fermentans]|jgi:formate dehydrogenase alpha subunit|uniref:Putative formate dehydrogenase alpha subunit n=1 Tax=Candidatus Brevifilum fermentans TaxID=1986204 RepID=A0A1Y6K611_9CHLR|nr:formate dehydrogenase subunit alpha [Brevefilum fermentans]MDI9566980.1 formate dehydrogenase subunit alpha [Chloroflexota bacterium]SMX54277.1 putative formate dehydrogenase alpha subunit [Brevefilum fermentans]
MTKLTINGIEIEAESTWTILEAAEHANITIPTLCYHKDLSPTGACRMCLVSVKGAKGLVTSCTTPVSEGMEVETENETLTSSRQSVLKLLLSVYHDTGYKPDETDNELFKWARHYGLDPYAHMSSKARFEVDSDPNPFIFVDMNKCILCTRCVRACAEIQGRFVWGVSERGFDAHIVAGFDEDLLDARCESCGACVAYCPTGALSLKPTIHVGPAEKLVTTTCNYCGVGCQFDLNVIDDRVVRVTSNPAAPANGMHLCVKGRFGFSYVHHDDRLTKPLVREYLLKGEARPSKADRGPWVETSWDTALDIVAEKLATARDTYGPDSVGVLSSAKCTNEENYLMNKFGRQVIGTNNVDHCARLCHSSTVAGLATALGSGAMTNSMADVYASANSILVIGSNTTEQHPVFGAKMRQAVLNRNVHLIVADPRRIELCDFAVMHIQQKPGTDIALINGLVNIILEKGYEDRIFIDERTENFDVYAENIKLYPPNVVSEITGVPVAQLYRAVEIMVKNAPLAVFWAMGITQHTVGVHNVFALAGLQMVLGNFGIPGGGVNPLRGQNNVQGACDMGCLVNVYPGYQAVTAEAAQQKFESAWGTSLSNKVGRTVTELIPDVLEGKTKALYILGENPAMTDPDSNHVRHCLEELDFLALQDIFPTETSAYADVLLPGVTFAEKTGTYTNTERKVQMVRQAISERGEARQDWDITAEIAKRIIARGGREINDAPYSSWDYADSGEIMAEVAALTPSYGGISHQRLNNGEVLCWPCPDPTHPGTPILHIGKFTRGRGNLIPAIHVDPAELPDDDYPMMLTTGRVIYHWHSGEQTRRVKELLEVYGEALIEISPEDASVIGLNEEINKVKVTSRRGEIIATAWVTNRVPEGLIYGNFHFPDANINYLTKAALDPIAKIPEYKVAAVKIEAV